MPPRPPARRSLLTAVPLAAALVLASGCSRRAPAPCAVLITMDTTRADVVGALGGRQGLTPNLDALAAEGTVFLAAHTVAPLTLPAHTSMLTGLWPPRHTVRDNNAKIPDAAVTLAERARDAGLETAAFVSSAALDRSTGADQGFEVFDQPAAPDVQTRHEFAERAGDATTDAALRWLRDRDRSRPFLLWVHYFDPHAPYAPPPGWAERAGHPYLGEVASMDHEIGRLLAGLRADPAWASTLVLAVGDHGEALGDHGEPTHSAFCYEAVLHVPLILRRPGGPAGARSSALVSVADVYPTIVEHLGLGGPGDVDGRSLLHAPPADRGLYFECFYGWLYYGWSPLVGWLDARGKYVHSARPELYDLASDPGEERSLDARLPEAGEPYRAAIAAALAEPRLSPDADAGSDQEHLSRLQAIGYAAAPHPDAALPDPLAPSGRPAPRDRAEELQTFLRCQGLAAAGQVDEAISGLEGIVRENPLHEYALYELGQLYKRARRFADAVEPLRRTIALGNDWYGPRFNLGVVLARLGRSAEAETELRRVIEMKPDFALAYEELAALYERLGRAGDAARVRAEAPPSAAR